MSDVTAPTRLHPLAPLTPDEVARAAEIIRGAEGFDDALRFIWTALAEPGKAAVARAEAGNDGLPRTALVVLYDRRRRTLIEARVALDTGSVEDWRLVEGGPPVSMEEHERAIANVKADPRWISALALRGIDDGRDVLVQAWPPGYPHPEPHLAGRRIANAIAWVGTGGEDNAFARPLEHLVAFVDLDTGEVLELRDEGVVPVPPAAGNYAPELAAEPGNWPSFDRPRATVRPIEITQPDGPSFTLDGRTLHWQNWELVVGFHPREGIVLHRVAFVDRGRRRSVLHRASLSEMWVPYGDPAIVHRVKNVFDEGECGLGRLANPLRLGCDCLGDITYLDGVANDEAGEPIVIPNAICIHEEDTGTAWKHTTESGTAEVRRGRRLVISSFSTIGNYDYGFFWYLHADGGIAYEVKLTGILSTGAFAPGATPAHGTVVAPGVYAPHHQHVFCVRLDAAVDGDANTVYEVDTVLDPPGPANPLGNAWRARWTPLEVEDPAGRPADPAAARTWLIANDDVTNAHGQPVAFQLVPGPTPAPAFHPDAPALRRAGFATAPLWVTAFDPGELYAAGAYPYGSAGGDGLSAWAAAGRPLRQRDVVVWHTFAAHHVARPEDWPVMPVTTASFHLRPFGFFDANPVLDLPRPHPAHERCASPTAPGARGNGHCGCQH